MLPPNFRDFETYNLSGPVLFVIIPNSKCFQYPQYYAWFKKRGGGYLKEEKLKRQFMKGSRAIWQSHFKDEYVTQ